MWFRKIGNASRQDAINSEISSSIRDEDFIMKIEKECAEKMIHGAAKIYNRCAMTFRKGIIMMLNAVKRPM